MSLISINCFFRYYERVSVQVLTPFPKCGSSGYALNSRNVTSNFNMTESKKKKKNGRLL